MYRTQKNFATAESPLIESGHAICLELDLLRFCLVLLFGTELAYLVIIVSDIGLFCARASVSDSGFFRQLKHVGRSAFYASSQSKCTISLHLSHL